MTIRFTPDGFLYAECPGTASVVLDDAPFHEVAPGPDYQQRLHSALLDAIPASEQIRDIIVQIVSTRVVILPPEVNSPSEAEAYYALTIDRGETDEAILLQHITLATGQEVELCYGIDRELYNFLMRNFGEVVFEHHLSTLLEQGARMASGNCMVVRCDRQYLELALFRQGKLDVTNVYRTTQAENRTYYIMNTWLQQKLDQLKDSLLVIGQATECLQVRASLHRFIKHVFA